MWRVWRTTYSHTLGLDWGKKKPQRHFQPPAENIKDVCMRARESDKETQGLGDFECFGLNSAEGFFISRLWKSCTKAFLFDVLISAASKGKSRSISLLFVKGHQTLVIPRSRRYVKTMMRRSPSHLKRNKTALCSTESKWNTENLQTYSHQSTWVPIKRVCS